MADSIYIKPLSGKASQIGLAITIVGLILAVISYIDNPVRAAYGNIIAFVFLFGLGTCSLFLVALEYISGAVWSVVFRRIAEFLSLLLIIAPILSIPVLFQLNEIFPWEEGSVYLNPTFFIIRLAAVTLIMSFFYFLITANSRKQDYTKGPELSKKNIRLSAAFIPIFGIFVTIIAIDWIMSIEPHWFSTIMGLYFFSGSILAAFAALTYIAVKLYEHGYLPEGTGPSHFYNLGAYLFAFTNIWAYIAFCQYLLIWYANIPEETYWFASRLEGDWFYISAGLAIINFVIPFAVLLSKSAKSNLKILKFMALWILLGRFYDIYWLIMPSYNADTTVFSWNEIGFPLLALGIVILVFSYMYKKNKPIPLGDPKLGKCLEFRLK